MQALPDSYNEKFFLRMKSSEGMSSSIFQKRFAERGKRPFHIGGYSYIRQKESKALGDAVLRAEKHIGDEPFAVLLDIIVSEITTHYF